MGKIGDYLIESKKESNNPDSRKRITVRLHVKGVDQRKDTDSKEGATKYYIRNAGQFIYGKQNFHKGAFGIIPAELDGFESSADLPSFDINAALNGHWFIYWLKQNKRYEEFSKLARGAGSQRVSVSDFLSVDIEVPPIDIQNEIVKKLNQLNEKLVTVEKETEHQEYLLFQLRQSILQEAIEGKLTAEWRKNNPVIKGDPDYDAAALLEKIKEEKERLIKEGKIKREKPLPPIKPEEIPFPLPEGWVWTRLGEVCVKIGAGSTPRGAMYSETGVPFLRSQNVHDEGLYLTDIKFISEAIHQKMKFTEVLNGDLVLNITGGSLGRCSYVNDPNFFGNVSQHVCIIRVLQINPNWLHRVILSPYFQKLVLSSTTGAGREGLPKNKLERFLIPVQSVKENSEIINELTSNLQKCNMLINEIMSMRSLLNNTLNEFKF